MLKIPGPPPERLLTTDAYTAHFRTAHGSIEFDLFAKECPVLVNNFIYLSTNGFYDKTTFHRVVPEFVLQGGDPTGSGAGDPGYFLDDEFGDRFHLRGTLAMANSGPNTNGSQFFIPLIDMPWLNELYCPIGQVASGADTLALVRQSDVVHTVSIYWNHIAQKLTWDDIVAAWKDAEDKQHRLAKKPPKS